MTELLKELNIKHCANSDDSLDIFIGKANWDDKYIDHSLVIHLEYGWAYPRKDMVLVQDDEILEVMGFNDCPNKHTFNTEFMFWITMWSVGVWQWREWDKSQWTTYLLTMLYVKDNVDQVKREKERMKYNKEIESILSNIE